MAAPPHKATDAEQRAKGAGHAVAKTPESSHRDARRHGVPAAAPLHGRLKVREAQEEPIALL
eukprot:1688256-Lingulodinium_polyedra.AAC.1